MHYFSNKLLRGQAVLSVNTLRSREKNSYTVLYMRRMPSLAPHVVCLVFAVFLALITPVSSFAAVLYLDPPEAVFGRGDTFMMSVRVDPEEDCINAAHVELSYPKESLRAVDFSRGSSILSLWIDEPRLDVENGMVTFEGGVPGGYCGRIPGDPVQSNILGKVVFTVTDAVQGVAEVSISPRSELYRNDGLGTKVALTVQGSRITLVPEPQLSENEWLSAVGADTIPPDAFSVELETMRGVFGGDYFAVFSTVDKQSGLDHYEIFEREAWKTIESPYRLKDQALRYPVQIKAIDKAGNERLGEFDENTVPKREFAPEQYAIIGGIALVLLLALFVRIRTRRAQSNDSTPPQTGAA